jgi:hypothetical protein
MKRPCNYPGCRALLDNGAYCDAHASHAKQRHKDYDQHVRANDPALARAAAIRNSPRWRAVRKWQLAREPLCFDPFSDHERRGTTETARQVHHIKGLATHPELAFHSSNLMSVCTGCHAKLEREAKAQGQ